MTAEEKALNIAENRGITDYKVKGNVLSYYTSYPMEKCTYLVTIDIETLEEERKELKKYYKKGLQNACL
ncbi:hypothetical protein EFP_121 [Enterococcus phage EF24C]|uniref:Uncharacterized protein n=1 Tax=Enterococcus phage phiEF24C TaxID=442493 RepID=A8E2H3_BPPHE|nr:hypothetical protein EFP_gp121 [Enterococcus phage EF24C]BAF81389.1 hypothetical protein EFP_121 [Enterococcus phage EF24C]